MVYHDIPFSIQSRMIIHGRQDLQMVVVSPAKIAMVHTEFIAGQVTGNPLALYHRTGMRRRVGDSENRIALCGVPLDHVPRVSPAWNLWHQRSLDPVWGFSLYTT